MKKRIKLNIIKLLSSLLILVLFSNLTFAPHALAGHEDEEEAQPLNISTNEKSSYHTVEIGTINLNPDQKAEIEARINRYYEERGVAGNHLITWSAVPATILGTIGTSFLFFLGKDLGVNFTHSQIVGNAVGAISHAPIAYLVGKMIKGKQDEVLRSFQDSWQNIRNKGTTSDTIKSLASYSVGVIMASVGVYYTYIYYDPLIGKLSWGLVAPTAIAQTILGSSSIDGLIEFFRKPALRYLFKNKSEVQIFKEGLEDQIDQSIAQVKTLNDDQVDELVDYIENGNLFRAIAKMKEGKISRYHRPLLSFSGVTGGLIALIGTYAMVSVTDTAANWLLTDICGIPGELAKPIATVCSYISGIAMGAFRGLGGDETFQNLFEYARSCIGCKRTMTPGQIATDSLAGGLAVVSTASRVQIALETPMTPEALKVIVTICGFISTGSNDFYGWKGIFDTAFHSHGKKAGLIGLLKSVKADLEKLDPQVLKALHEAWSVQ